ncbi:MAG: YgjP-like metallopeptidase domain-containing protein [Georgfuchsia sp.]
MKLRNQTRSPQRTLFDADPGVTASLRWRDGAQINYLGVSLRLKLDTDRRQALREDIVLHLPLPPEATERQVQDAAESWLRREAETLFSRMITHETQRTGRDMPFLSLSFSLRGGWIQVENHALRLNWRLIEQPLQVIELTLRRAVAMLPIKTAVTDLFSAMTS